jgi:uncharacterized membrane protein
VSPRAREESVHPRLQSGACARPLNFTVREQRPVRTAAILFALLVATIAVFNAIAWTNGAPVRVTVLMAASVGVYCALSILLWRRNRIAAAVGVFVAALGSLIFGGAIYFMWPIISTELTQSRGTMEIVGTMVGPFVLNVGALGLLSNALLSNNRWRGP